MKPFIFLIFLVFLSSCSVGVEKDKKIDSLKADIEYYKNKVQYFDSINYSLEITNQGLRNVRYTKYYAYVTLRYYTVENEFLPSIREFVSQKKYYNYWSSIQEVSSDDDDTKYKLLDNAEPQIRYYLGTSGKIESRECFFFQTYAEASKSLEQRKPPTNTILFIHCKGMSFVKR